MNRKYNIFVISRLYLRRYYTFLIEETKIVKTDEAESLFLYSMRVLYGLESNEFNSSILDYGAKCVEYLKDTPGTPQNRMNMSFEDRVHLISVCEGFIHASQLLIRKSIQGGRSRKE